MKYVGPIMAIAIIIFMFNHFLNQIAIRRGEIFIDLEFQRCFELASIDKEKRQECFFREKQGKKLNKKMTWVD